MITVTQIVRPAEMQHVFAIREEVFVKEQHVRKEDEYDEFETTSHHFLALYDGTPCGTARWRTTSNGVKLERFAVLAAYRGKGVGQRLVQAVLDDIFSQQPEPIESVYLNAQLTAMPLYAKFGFKAVGPMFEECGIQHYKMVLPASSFPD
ncbi:GNAT family N-acetyltransferase [Larkinella rosea]|uniref:GNAT family N-acetyltransferase n=1 Tax=Larkinella rosea TaxID=2025312 RepID=A0A3P1C2B9_9BACT|nr:GNAT family N-acetyltransferase [Larkinella rosea]RRB06944.1 GNAT family N-acetyltransferase [Larkinella rosea]